MFGFHDLVQTNAKGDLALALEIDDISHPPLPGESCKSGVVDLATKEFLPIHDTHTWNYPQGSRQQWIGDGDVYLCNDREDNGKLVSRIVDARSRKIMGTLPFPVHCLSAELGKAIYINYDRLHSVGAYGYVPNKAIGYTRITDVPDNDGLWIGDFKGEGKGELLVSFSDILSCGEKKPVRTGFPHYVTHPMLNPSGTRVAFLHRYRVPDGGETTRLMTVGIDGRGLRCLAKGFLSHFTWTAEDEIFIWGGHQPRQFALREAFYLRLPGGVLAAKCAKGIIRGFRRLKTSGRAAEGASSRQALSFLAVQDSEGGYIRKAAEGVITADGHPMARPGDLRTVISDTYPDNSGDRQLYFYNLDTGRRSDVGVFRRIFKIPDKSKFNIGEVQSGTDGRIAKRFDLDHYLFARSGLHCDLHPRWSADGRYAFFDSIHEGTRQLYMVEIPR